MKYIYIYKLASLNIQPLAALLPSVYTDNDGEGFPVNSGWRKYQHLHDTETFM